MLAEAMAEAMRASLASGAGACLNTLLHAADRAGSPAATARPALAPHMPRVFAEAARRGARGALQALLVCLPEHFEALGPEALEAAAAAGQHGAAADIRLLLSMRAGVQEPAVELPAAAAAAAARNAGLEHAASLGAGSIPDACVYIDACPSPGGVPAAAPYPKEACGTGSGGSDGSGSSGGAPCSSAGSDCSSASAAGCLARADSAVCDSEMADNGRVGGGVHGHHYQQQQEQQQQQRQRQQQQHVHPHASSGGATPPQQRVGSAAPVHPYMRRPCSTSSAGESSLSGSPANAGPAPPPPQQQPQAPRGATPGGGGGDARLRASLRRAICCDDVARAALLLTELVDATERPQGAERQQQQQQPLDAFVLDLISAAAAAGACDCAHLLLTAIGGNDDGELKSRAARALCAAAAARGRCALLRAASAHHPWVAAAMAAGGAALGRECLRAAILCAHPHTAVWVARSLPCGRGHAQAAADALLAAPAWQLRGELEALAGGGGCCGGGGGGCGLAKKRAAAAGAAPDAGALVDAFSRAWAAAAS
ncbi:hypothetical protein MNEG_9744 [Monoraphidium neglectum]|uniref:Uncharacterized protein n=1 Tax=Monoraphidium neglectum TaxID=145388 RepID=A0A0D2M3T1_9CHLO|nr:hypothetical protein MNEG_9744 [Monoraphidium neglectum]KIY98219.1 hypothetical protein MNEG_9744 [Monoraphidium neglectum]|eukprot:XP_013897239.1 hypothetical protein MNEG_9744 [Monoraphidium neglectum]